MLIETVPDSDIIRISALGTNIVVVNSLEAVNELLDKRSAIYSDRYGFWRFCICRTALTCSCTLVRPRMVMLNELYVHAHTFWSNTQLLCSLGKM